MKEPGYDEQTVLRRCRARGCFRDRGQSNSEARAERSDATETGPRKKILEAVVTNDWVGLETHSRELEWLTHDPAWTVLTFPDYAKHSLAFVKTLQDLHRAAAQRDTERAPKAYVALTLQCVECHQYLARERFAQ